ncbi:hypothetical protein Q4508_04725 [Amphritea sp. 2_MG-2023]|nr:hypothetical protein [Amphritea sp. 2_MG-2023]
MSFANRAINSGTNGISVMPTGAIRSSSAPYASDIWGQLGSRAI